MKQIINKNTNKSEGHRKRLREKFLNSGLSGFHDYEIVELLLTLGTPRKDCKQVAKDAMLKFKNLSGVLDASVEDLQEVRGIGPANVLGIKLFQAIYERYAKEKISDSDILDSPEKIFEYLREKIGKKEKEYFIIMFFDTRNRLIIDEVSVGTLNASLVHPREVFTKAIKNKASYVVVAHNHPSGDIEPSEEDINTTKRLIEAGKLLGINLVDHIIVSKNDYKSLREVVNF
jgi:DNA repair protein RadC